MKNLILITIIIFISYINSYSKDEQIKINIPQVINLTENDIKSLLLVKVDPKFHYDTIEITIYYFSIGPETISYSDDKDLTITSHTGSIKALIKYKKDKKLEKVQFISATGNNKEEILNNLSSLITKLLNK